MVAKNRLPSFLRAYPFGCSPQLSSSQALPSTRARCHCQHRTQDRLSSSQALLSTRARCHCQHPAQDRAIVSIQRYTRFATAWVTSQDHPQGLQLKTTRVGVGYSPVQLWTLLRETGTGELEAKSGERVILRQERSPWTSLLHSRTEVTRDGRRTSRPPNSSGVAPSAGRAVVPPPSESLRLWLLPRSRSRSHHSG